MNQPWHVDLKEKKSNVFVNSSIESLKFHEALIFLQPMQTGDKALSRLLREHYHPHQILHYNPHKQGEKLDYIYSLSEEEREHLRFLHGHLYFGFHQHLNQPCHYVTILRNLLSRVISLYYFIHQNSNQNLPKTSRYATLRQYLECKCLELDNDQTRRIAGDISHQYAFGECTPELLEVAKQNLRNFLVVGVTERFDESILVLTHALGLEKVLYSHSSDNSYKPKIEDVDSWDIEKIQHSNELDNSLYQYANELLDEKIQHMGDRFHVAYTFFQWDAPDQ